MRNAWLTLRAKLDQRGQSLVEVSLFIPLLIFILAGLVEVSNLLITQNKVTTSSRDSAGFGAANYDPDQWASIDPVTGECVSGLACSMGDVAINTVTETLDLDPNLWDVWAVHAVFNVTGTDFAYFTATHVYGTNTVISTTEWSSTLMPALRAEMLADLLEGPAPTPNLAVVGTVDYHNLDTILGLPVWQWVGLKTVRGFTVMRADEPPPYAGCPLLPIAIRFNQFSIYPTNWTGGARLDPLNDPVALFPDYDDGWDYPQCHPIQGCNIFYVTETPGNTQTVSSTTFIRNAPGVPLEQAQPGYIYWARETGPSGNFAWLSWRGGTAAGDLEASLNPATYGNFYHPQYGYPGSESDLGTSNDLPFTETGDGDGKLEPASGGEPGEWVANSTGFINSSTQRNYIKFYIDSGRPIFLVVFGNNDGETGENLDFEVVDFAKVRLIGWGGSSYKWIIFEFLAWGIECYGPAE